ncbi:TPM domain-containing protein [Albidovulum sp.]|uniref:TPM domain-containing protein n=1 Tax=Albidovulum sp. TaxID=1872424 RepID=UPI0039B87D94
MRQLFICFALWLAPLGGPLRAEPWPAPADPFVTDLAEVLPAPEEEALRSELQALRAETGVELTVLPIAARGDYDPSASIETFAAGLFNAWGIGDAGRNDGILVLVASQDHEMRVQLGSAYDQGYDVLAQDIVSRFFLPDLRDDDPARGIVGGSREVMARIARPHAAALPAEALPSEGGGLPGWLPVALFAAGAGLLVFRRRLGDRAQVLRRCPSCGRFGLRRTREGLNGAAGETEGQATTRIACRRCGFHENRDPRIPRQGKRDEADGGGFGGGRSSGGGATGRW